ncbi:MAG: GNAT family N-acetyltransferase [Solirubrobacterales bacterium]
MTEVRRGTTADAADLGRLLHDFNTEFSSPTPDAELLAERIGKFIERGDATFLLVGAGPDGFAEITYKRVIDIEGLNAHLQELYVIPSRRGQGLGRALLEAAMETARERGAEHMDLGTSEDDTAAIALYESAGFSNRENRPDGPRMYYYERDL